MKLLENIYWSTDKMKTIMLTQGKETTVYNRNYKKLSMWNWYANCIDGVWYAMRNGRDKHGKKIKILMHRVIMKAPDGMMVDHKNHDGLDNRISNLRICTNGQNQRNRRLSKNNTSGVNGVTWYKNSNKWLARIHFNGVQIYLGYYVNLEDAVKARLAGELKYYGKYQYDLTQDIMFRKVG